MATATDASRAPAGCRDAASPPAWPPRSPWPAARSRPRSSTSEPPQVNRRRGREPDLFFDHFRAAVARLPAGLIRVMPPAAPADLGRAAEVLGRPLPSVYEAFLRSFDGADLFHETLLLAGLGAAA